ncbi:MAG: LysR family transcriptional regulator [Clostridia bacterium]|nr:LysR family transcriptional regulator [Clostridia bacterium]
MEVRVLRYFLAVAREGSISAAADALHLSQPTLSRQIHDLEEELGAQLFIRGSRSISLTEAGTLLRQRAEEVVTLIHKTELEIARPDEIIRGSIHIGSAETESIRILADTAEELIRDYPGIKYHLFSGNADDVMERLDKGLLDFGLLIEPCDLKKYNEIRLPVQNTWGVLMKKDSPLATKSVIVPDDLYMLPLICSGQTKSFDHIKDWFGEHAEDLNIVATYNLLYNASILVEEGLGYVLCLDNLINTTGDSVLCFRPLSPSVNVSLSFVWKKYQILSAAADLFLKLLKQKVENQP